MNIRQARKKIKSVGSVRKITKAMQLVSAIKMKKAQQVALEGRPYQEQLELIIRKVMSKTGMQYSELLSPATKLHAPARTLVIVVSTNKGLCGAFNVNLFRFITRKIDFKNTDFVVVGKKAAGLSKYGAKIIADYSSNTPLDNVSALFTLVLSNFKSGIHKEIVLFYNQFISMLKNEPTMTVLLPFTMIKEKNQNMQELEKIPEYMIEPNPELIINQLINSYVESEIRNAIIQNDAGEHSSRMIAMKNATENANDVIYNLTLLRNKLRQEKITNELLDMITAKESVEQN